MVNEKIESIKKTLPQDVELIAVSKTKPLEMIQQAMESGHLDFGENKVQEMVHKHASLPQNIRWHMIGHLQRNKVKYIAPFVYLIHGADSKKLLDEINKQGLKNNKTINCLLQFHIASESTKFGFSIEEIRDVIDSKYHLNWENINIQGVMGMATFTNDKKKIKAEFSSENLNISFNSKYLIDIASEVEDKNLKMNLKDSVSPVLIEDASDKNSFYVIMPMKI